VLFVCLFYSVCLKYVNFNKKYILKAEIAWLVPIAQMRIIVYCNTVAFLIQAIQCKHFVLKFHNEHTSKFRYGILSARGSSINAVVGVDALPDREGGTWFGVSLKFAKIGALLNIFQPEIDTSKRPRGHLVPDYLQTEQDAGAYIKTIARHQEEFNPFNLVLLEQRFV